MPILLPIIVRFAGNLYDTEGPPRPSTAPLRLKYGLAAVFHRLDFTRRMLNLRARGTSAILMYHRIIPPESAAERVQPGMYVFPRTFDMHLRYLKEMFVIRPLDEYADWVRRPPGRSGRPSCFITFDDGWQDFFRFAYPLLCAHEAHATVFLPTDFIGSEKQFWIDRLTWILKEGESRRQLTGRWEKSSDPMIDRIVHRKAAFDVRLDACVEWLKSFREERINSFLDEWVSDWGLAEQTPERQFLNWGEVRAMRDSKRVAFGSHTASHRIMTHLSASEIRQELSESRERLIAEKAVGNGPIAFCYPNGNFTSAIAELVKAAGYHLAVTTRSGWNSRDQDLFSLKRIGLHQDVSAAEPMFSSRLAGIF
jgi:peptidoglycan/xylan/chitin deacetylase (PgdA/CDA1 family)